MLGIFLAWAAAPAQADVPLLSLDATWRYQQTTNLDGQSWQLPGYDDSTWPAGNALLYVENNVLVSPKNTPLTIGRTTYYFRTHLACPFDPTNVILTVSARIDDGAVFYLNGQEIQRVRMPPAPATITYTNLATATPLTGDAVAVDVFTLAGADLSSLRTGDNLLAAEVHQNATNSDDIAFGAAVMAKLTNSPPFVVQQPTDVAVVDGRPATLFVVVDGNPAPTLQWYRDGVPLPGATNALLNFVAAYPADTGTYRLAATNTFGGLVSSNAVLAVLQDTNAPTITTAVAQKDVTSIDVSFSEPFLVTTAMVTNNYAVLQTSLPVNHLDVVGVSLLGSTSVRLRTSPRVPGLNYSLRVNGIRDISSVSNAIAPNTEAALSYQVDVVPVDALTTWRYFQAGFQPDTNWTSPAYDDSAWPQGAALFAGGTPAPTGDAVRTVLELGAGTNVFQTFYFRTFFDLPGPADTNSLRLHHVVDDGAVFYLNGAEVYSIGMPSARPVLYSTAATRSVGTAIYEPPLTATGWSLPGTNLALFHNCLAVEVHQSVGGLGDASFGADLEATITHYNPKPQLVAPAFVQEGAGTLTNQAAVVILEPQTNDLVFQMTSSRSADVSAPASVTIPAGATNVVFDLVLGNDSLFNGPRLVTLTASSTGLPTAAATVTVLDDETNSLSIAIGPLLAEGAGAVTGEVRLSQPAGAAIAVALASSDVTALMVPPSVTFAAGATSAVFQATVVDDLFLDGPQVVTLTASVLGWPAGSTAVVVSDNEVAALTLALPPTTLEGSGVLSNAARLTLGGLAVSNVVVTLTSSLPGSLVVPTNVTVLAGQSNAVFSLTVPDNFVVESNRLVTVTAIAPGFPTASALITVIENDPDHIRFGPLPLMTDTNTAVDVQLFAENANGLLQTNFNLRLTILAEGLEGMLPIEPTNSGPFTKGQAYSSFRVAVPGHAVRLRSLEYPGQSEVFNVEPPMCQIMTQAVADLAWHAQSRTLFATVPSSGGIYSNRLVAIDPYTRTVTNSYPIGSEPGEISLSPDGSYLYFARSNGNVLQRFDLDQRQAGIWFSRGVDYYGFRNYITGFAVPAGFRDSVVVATDDAAGNYTGVFRYDSGTPTALGGLSGTKWVINSPVSSIIYGWGLAGPLYSPAGPLLRGSAYGSVMGVNANLPGGSQLILRQDALYDNGGNVAAADSLAIRGKYPGVWDAANRMAIVEVDPDARRTFFFTGTPGSGSPTYAIKVYDRDLYVPLGQVKVPLSWDPPGRFLRWATNSLVFNVGNQIWFIRSDFLQPTQAPADLSLEQTLTPLPALAGSNVLLTLVVSNAGPGIASVVCVTNSLPSNTSVGNLVQDAGTVSLTSSAFTWKLGPLPPGSNATLAVTLRFGNSGWQTNLAYALGYEADPVFANNRTEFPLYVQLPPAGNGTFLLNYASEDMLYDPARDRLLLSVGNGLSAGQTNGLAVLNPYTGLTEAFAALGKKPARLARSADSPDLYVSLADDALVRRLDLATLTTRQEFGLGGTLTGNGDWLPFFAADLAVMPGAPNSLAVWRKNLPLFGSTSGGNGIAMYDNGVMRSNTAVPGGTISLEFDIDSRKLYAFNAVSDYWAKQGLYRCDLSPDGVTSSSLLLPEYGFSGQDLRYARGRMFTSAARVALLQPVAFDWIFAGSETATLVETDATSGRVFYLMRSNGWQINAYDMESRRMLGSIPVPNVAGTPTSLIRWGTNGLAFRTSSNQVFIVRTPLVEQSAAADLAVAIEGPSTPVEAGMDTLLTLTLTNRGPFAAVNVVLTNTFSPGITIDRSFCTNGGIVATNGQVIWNLAELRPGQNSLAGVVLRAGQTGAVSVAASVTSATPDAWSGDNFAFQVVQVGGGLGNDGLVMLQLAANDLVWSPSLGRLLLTSTTNTPSWAGSLLSLDPATLAVRFESALGSDAGRLTVSRDDHVLYAGADYGVNVLNLPGLVVTNHFVINPGNPQGAVYDMEVVPGSDEVVLVGSRNRSNNSTWLDVYDRGQPGTNGQSFFTSGFNLEFGDTPSLFYYQDYAAGGFQRYQLDLQSICLLDKTTTLLPIQKAIELKWADGLLYTSWGIVIDPVTRQSVRSIPGLTNNSPLCYDSAAKRVFYLMPAGSNAVLQAIDAATTVPLGSRVVSGFSGAPAGLVRWGADGLAFRTSSGQIGLLRSSLVPSGPSADLQVSISALDTLAFVGSNFVYSLTVTNLGGNAASNAQIALRVPDNVTVVGVLPSQGSGVTGPQQALANLGTLPPGGTAQALVTVVPAQPGTIVAVASATSSALDPDPASNSRSLSNSAVIFVARDNMVVLVQAAADLVVNPANGRLYVSGNAGSVAVINPALAQVETNWPVPTQPGRLAVSDDGQALYVSHDSGRQLARLETAAGGVVTNFTLGTNTGGAAFTLVDMEVIPGTPGTVVVNEQDGGARYLAVMDDGMTRPDRPFLPYPSNGSFLGFGNDPSVVYISGLMPVLISSNGAAVVSSSSLFSTSANFKYGDGFFYTDAGDQVDPTNRIAATRFTGLGTGTLVATEIARHRVYFLTRIGTVWQLRAYDSATTDLVGTLAITNVFGTPSALARWGDDGLAFCTSSNQVFLLRPSLVPGGGAADLRLTQTPTPAGPVDVGSDVTFVVQITNAGPAAASGVRLLSLLPTNATLVQAQLSQGTTNLTNNLLTCALGTLTNGGTAQLTLILRPLSAGALVHRVTATSANTDPDLGNNIITASVGVQLNLSPDVPGIVGLQTADMEYDPVSGLLYATLTDYLGAPFEDSIVPIDPATGLLLKPIRVAPNLSNLTIGDDGSCLYVIANSGAEFRRINLPLGSNDLRVLTNATEIKAVPGQPRSLAVVHGSAGVVIFDGAEPRPNSLMWYNHIEFFAPTLLMGFWANVVPNATARLALEADGVKVLTGNAADLVDGTIKADGGLIYTSGGSVIDPMTLTKIRSFGVSGPVAPDHTVDRVCFLTGSGTTKVLRVFDTQGQREWGSLTITNVLGTVDKLIRCGADRLAFRTSAGRVYLLRSSSIPTGPAADLAVGMINSIPTPTAGQPFSMTLTVTNLGPSAAAAVIVSNVLPASMTVVSSEPSAGFVAGASPGMIWQVGDLAVGAVATNHLVLLPQQGGTFAAKSMVWANGVTDANADNDSAGMSWLVHNSSSPAALSTLALAAGDLIWERNSQRLLLSVVSPSPVASNTVLRLDPVSGQFDPPIPVGAQPGRLAASDDGQFVYVGQDADGTLAKLQWPIGKVMTNYSVGKVVQIELPPAYQDLFVLLEGGNIDAYLNGAELPLYMDPSWVEPATITRPDSAGRFYGYVGSSATAYFTPTFYRMTVNNTSWTINDATGGLLSGPDTTIEYANGLLFASSGSVLHPETLTIVTNIPDLSSSSLVCPDPGLGLLTFLTPKSGEWWLRQYSHSSYSLQREFRVPSLKGTPKSLIRWGADGFAFLTTSNQVYLVRPGLAFADVAVVHKSWPAEAVAGQPFQLSLSVTNYGPSFAAEVYVTNTPPSPTTILEASCSQGIVIITNRQAVFALGDIDTNTVVTLSLTLRPTNSSDLLLTNTAFVSSAFTDLQPGNNSSLLSLLARADTDRDGLPDSWELGHGLNPTNAADALLDSDGDGIPNLQEYLAGTDPMVFDRLNIVSARIRGHDVCDLTLHAAVGVTYALETSTNLVQWSPLCTFLCPGTNYTVQAPFDAAAPALFFRLHTTTNLPVPILSLLNATMAATNQPLLQIAAPPGHRYAVTVSSNLADWVEWTNFSATTWKTWISDPAASGSSPRFYRAMTR